MKGIELSSDGARLSLETDLVFSSIVVVRSEVEQIIKSAPGPLVIDFKKVAKADSSALSLYLCCMRLATKLNKKITLEHIPSDMKSISDLAGLNHF